MPELPDIEAYLDALRNKALGKRLTKVRLRSVFLVRSTSPPVSRLEEKRLVDLWRLGKRIVMVFEDAAEELFVVLHLMISGRLQWSKPGAGLPGKRGLCAFDFENGTLLLTEASKKKRASLYVVSTRQEAEDHDPGGLEVLTCDPEQFAARLTSRNHTLKRALTDPRLFAGIGGAYADEIMHHARLSPLVWTTRLDEAQIEHLFVSTREVLAKWVARIQTETGDGWPVVTAFRDDMSVHGKFGLPCPICGSEIQRIVYAENETNYCPTCQTDGKVLADRSLSRLLKGDWPRTVEELEMLRGRSGR